MAQTLLYNREEYAILQNSATKLGVTQDIDQALESLGQVAKLYETRRVAAVKKNDTENAERLKQKVKQTDAEVKKLLDLYAESKLLGVAGKEAYRKLPESQDEPITPDNYKDMYVPTPGSILNEEYSRALEEYRQLPQSSRFAQARDEQLYNKYNHFRRVIHLASGSTRQMAELETFFDDYVADDDLEVEEARMSYKCPLTGALFVEPVTNPDCNHTYSKAAVKDYIRRKTRYRETLDCPVIGCSKLINPRALAPNPQIASEIEEYRSQLERERLQANTNLEQL